MTDRVAAVLFDFSGTLFRFEERDEWFDGRHDENGRPFDLHAQAEIIRRMTAPVGTAVELSADDRYAWERRDLDPVLHRQAYMAVLDGSGVPAEHASALYERVVDPASWIPYPDTVAVLRGLAKTGTPVGIVSNIAFDVRRVFADHGIAGCVTSWSLSYEVGAMKPDTAIFSHALSVLGVDGSQTVMVGDSPVADGAAQSVGCAFAEVEPLPVAQRPDALSRVVGRYAPI